EDHFLGESEAHAVGGELRIEAPRVRWDILDAFCAAAEQAGIKRIPDFNTGDNEGSCVFHVNQKRGRRWSAAPICGSKPSAWWKRSCSTARAQRGCAGSRTAWLDRRAPAAR